MINTQRIISAAFVLIFMLGGGVLFAQEPAANTTNLRRISVGEAVRLAITNNLSLQSNQVTVDTRKRAADTSWNQFIPTVSLTGALAVPNEAPSSPLMDLARVNVNGQVSVQLALNLAMFESMKRLRLDYQGGLLTYDKAKLQLERDVRKAYNNLLLMDENIALAQEKVAASRRQVDAGQANYRAGLAPDLMMLQAQVALANDEFSLNQAENNRRLVMAQFAMSLGLSLDTEFVLEPLSDDTVFIPLEIAALINQAANNKPDILELRQQLLLLQSGKKAAVLQQYTPNLVLSWSGSGTSILRNPFAENYFEKDNWQKGGQFSIALSYTLNSLLPFGKEGTSRKDLDDNQRSLNIGLAQAIQGTELEIYNMVFTLQNAQAQAEVLSGTVGLAQQSYDRTEQAYRAGLSSLLDLQNAGDQLNQAKLGIIAQNFTYRNGLLDLEYAIGAPYGSLRGSTK